MQQTDFKTGLHSKGDLGESPWEVVVSVMLKAEVMELAPVYEIPPHLLLEVLHVR